MAVIRILAVDDDPAALNATSRILQSAGYEVVGVSTGAAALAAAAKADLVVLDVNLPDMDGFEVRRRLRANPATTRLPVLHLSATFTRTADFTQALEPGADGYLIKAVEAPVLIATVRTLLFARQSDIMRRGLDAQLRTLFTLAPTAMAILDDAFRYESVNPAYCALTGYTTEELIGQPGDMVMDSDSLSSPEIGSGWTERLNVRRKDGSSAQLEWQIAAEKVSGVRIMIANVTTRQLQSETVREQEFLATLSHELRNPLNAIMGWTAVLNRKPDLSEEIRNGLRAIERNSKIQAQMIADLLDQPGITFQSER